MSAKSTAQPPLRNHTAFSGKTLLYIALAMITIYFMAVVLYPMLFNSERVRGSSLMDQPVIPPPMK